MRRKRLQFQTRKSPALRGFVGGPWRKRHRVFILCFYRTGRFPAQFPIGGAKAGANSADACPGYRDATLTPKAAHSGSQGRTARLHLHLRCLHLLLAELLRVDTETHAGLLLAVLLHLPQQDILLGCVERIAPALLGAISLKLSLPSSSIMISSLKEKFRAERCPAEVISLPFSSSNSLESCSSAEAKCDLVAW